MAPAAAQAKASHHLPEFVCPEHRHGQQKRAHAHCHIGSAVPANAASVATQDNPTMRPEGARIAARVYQSAKATDPLAPPPQKTERNRAIKAPTLKCLRPPLSALFTILVYPLRCVQQAVPAPLPRTQSAQRSHAYILQLVASRCDGCRPRPSGFSAD